MPRITPNLWFDDNGLEAAEFYVSVFPNSKVTTVTHYTEAGPGPSRHGAHGRASCSTASRSPSSTAARSSPSTRRSRS